MDALKDLINTHKICTRCGDLKNRTEFHHTKKTKSGIKSTCKVCDSLYAKQYYQTTGKSQYLAQKAQV